MLMQIFSLLLQSWDEGLAITARAWAKFCRFQHNSLLRDPHRLHPVFRFVGENIWTGYPPSYFKVTKAVEKWVNETYNYNYSENRCSGICGHYTQVRARLTIKWAKSTMRSAPCNLSSRCFQVVWATSYKVGCAAQLCPKGVAGFDAMEGVLFVCNYAEA